MGQSWSLYNTLTVLGRPHIRLDAKNNWKFVSSINPQRHKVRVTDEPTTAWILNLIRCNDKNLQTLKGFVFW